MAIFTACANGLIEAGAELCGVYDPDPKKTAYFLTIYPDIKVYGTIDDVLNDASIQMVACAAIPKDRCEIGIRAMKAGKDFFSDKSPLVSFEQLERCKSAVTTTGRKFMVYFSERLHVECAVYAERLIDDGAIGRVIHMDGFGPHRLSPEIRPEWFFDKKQYGGILCDIGCHQMEQFLFFSGAGMPVLNSPALPIITTAHIRNLRISGKSL